MNAITRNRSITLGQSFDASHIVELAIVNGDALNVPDGFDPLAWVAGTLDAAVDDFEAEFDCAGYVSHEIYLAAAKLLRASVKADIDAKEAAYETAYMRAVHGMVRT